MRIEVGDKFTTDFTKNRNIACHDGQAALHGFYQWQTKAFDKGWKHQRLAMVITEFKFRVVEIVEHEKPASQFRMFSDAFNELAAFPADAPDNT